MQGTEKETPPQLRHQSLPTNPNKSRPKFQQKIRGTFFSLKNKPFCLFVSFAVQPLTSFIVFLSVPNRPNQIPFILLPSVRNHCQMPIMHASFTSFNYLVDKYQDVHARNSKLSSPKKKAKFFTSCW